MAGLKDLDGALDAVSGSAGAESRPETRPTRTSARSSLRAGRSRKQKPRSARPIEVAPKAVCAHLALASFLWASKRFAEAETELKAALALEPENVGHQSRAGRLLHGDRPWRRGRAVLQGNHRRRQDRRGAARAGRLLHRRWAAHGRREGDPEPLNKKTDFTGPAPLRLAAIEVAREQPHGWRPRSCASVLDKTPKYAPARVFNSACCCSTTNSTRR